MKTVMIIAGGSIALALVVPHLVPERTSTPGVNESNIIRQAPNNRNFSSSKTKRMKSRNCFEYSDFGDSRCGQSAYREPPSGNPVPAELAGLAPTGGASQSRTPPPRKKRTGLPKKSAGGRSVMVESDASGHFQTVARMNGRRVPVLVDTGATNVAINMSLARKLGIRLSDEDFVHQAQTANGIVQIAKTEIRDIRIGGIVLDEVEAFVMPDKALSTTLLGMSFLKRLTKYQVQNGELKMTQ